MKGQTVEPRALIADLWQQYAPAELMRCPKCGGTVFRSAYGYPGEESGWVLSCWSGTGCDFEARVREEDRRVSQLCEETSRLLGE